MAKGLVGKKEAIARLRKNQNKKDNSIPPITNITFLKIDLLVLTIKER